MPLAVNGAPLALRQVVQWHINLPIIIAMMDGIC
jgi:hypothetical protein